MKHDRRNSPCRRSFALLVAIVFLGAFFVAIPTHAATFSSAKSLVVASSTPDNAYLAGTSVTISALLPADAVVAGGTINVFAPIEGDALLAGGVIDSQKAIGGDVRAIGGRVLINGDVTGDVVAAGGYVEVGGHAHDMLLAGGTVHADATTDGSVTIYGADVTLGGDITGDVTVIASDHFTLAPHTYIHGSLKYNAPVALDKSQSAVIDGTTTYTGSYSYVPTNAEARTFAVAGAGIFFLIRALTVMIVAGLLAGLFPYFTQKLNDPAWSRSFRRVSLTTLLGFAVLVATPVLLVLLLLSFVGIGIALLLGLVYILAVMLAYVYAGILLGGTIARYLRKESQRHISWQVATLGMLGLFLLGSVPGIGGIITVVAICISLGALSLSAYRFAFSRTTDFYQI